MQACIESLDSVRFDQIIITDVPEPVPANLWLDHTITSTVLYCTIQGGGASARLIAPPPLC